MENKRNSQTGNMGKQGEKMEEEYYSGYYSSGEVSRKLGVPRRTIADRAAKGRVPGEIRFAGQGHRRYRRQVIDRLAEGTWLPIKSTVKDGNLEIEFRGLASDPLRIIPCPGELPEINAPKVHLPGGPTLPAWRLPRIPSPFEVMQNLERHLWR